MNLYNVVSNRYVGMSNFERLFAQKFGGSGGEIKELEGAPPLTFTANGQPLLDYRIYGNTVQTGTPTPDNPIIPSGCGELETTGVHAGQYKLPLTSAGQGIDIYLGEVQTTRRIKKYEMTGEEKFIKNTASATNYLFYTPRSTLTGSIARTPIVCDSLQAVDNPPISRIGISTVNDFGVAYFNFGADVMNAQPSGNTIEGLKEYLAAQYAAGTPVTVWYALAEPETAVVNEPLMKIGDYADTVSMEQAGVSIPTSKGSNTLDVDTTIKPSNVYIKYHT